ncbi:hypothetical protein QZM26_17765 [Burkholderia multivorans]|nr:hypothetical protein [Burkholderia multivorans]
MDRLIAPNTVIAAQADTAPATGTPGYATDGNPASNIPATRWPAYQYNAIQEELMAIIAAGGLMPDRTNNAQVAAAITRICLSTAVLADTGAANAYAAANTPPLTVLPSTGFIQRISIAHANTGASTYAPDGLTAKPIYGLGLQPLQGGELVVNGIATLIYLVAPTVNSGNGAWILMECAGGAQQVAPATWSNHAAQLGQVLGKQALFSSSGSFTVPAGVTTIYVTGVGGGGGGGGGGGNGSTGAAGGGGGGGQGQQVIKSPITVAPGQILTITIGSGGASGTAGSNSGSSGGNGGVGGVSSITGSSPTVSLTLQGGQGGLGGIGNTGSGITSSGQGGLSGDGVTGSGSGGYPPVISGGVFPGMGGAGGASIFGAGGSCRVPTSGGGGVPAMGWGAGGSGGTGGCGSAATGGAGGQGKSGAFVLEW